MSLPVWLRPDGDGCLLDIIAAPNAKRSAVEGEHGEALRVRIGAPAVDGKANAALIALMASACGVPKRDVAVRSGASSRIKRLRIEASADAVWLRLQSLLNPARGG